MMRVVVTGAGSYIGAHIAAWLGRFPDRFDVREADVRGEWNRDALSGCGAVIHVAGIAHQRETEENRPLYDQVNRALAVEVAREAKARGVKQFVFFSSMSVYGLVSGRITADTQPAPASAYGVSKWRAEQELAALADDEFRVGGSAPAHGLWAGLPGKLSPPFGAGQKRFAVSQGAKRAQHAAYRRAVRLCAKAFGKRRGRPVLSPEPRLCVYLRYDAGNCPLPWQAAAPDTRVWLACWFACAARNRAWQGVWLPDLRSGHERGLRGRAPAHVC